MKIYKNISELVGNTPLVELCNIEKNEGLDSCIFAKLESFNPAGSAKDRVAREMIDEAEKSGKLTPGSVIIEPTSGNTGIGLAAIGVSRGYRVILTMPDTMSVERRKLLSAYGAEIVLTEGTLGMTGAVDKAEELAASIPYSCVMGQFSNPANPASHQNTTGPEIWRDTDGKVDIFVATVGTGGTISGVGRYLKEQNPCVKIIAVEPSSSPLLSCGVSGAHKIQGIGANFIPDTLDRDIYDEIVCVSDKDAYDMGKRIARSEGLLVGISSGACISAAVSIAKREENRGKVIVALCTDTGERYLSTTMYDED